MFAESFDGVTAPNLPAGWSQTSTGTNAWNTVAGALSHSAPNHAFVANPSTVSDARLTSAVFVPTAGMSVLNFRNFYDTEEDWDGGVLEISINGGGFSDILVAGGSFLSGGYTSPLNASDNPLSLRPAWHGNSGGFLSTVVRLPDASLNQNSVLRWRFGSDGLFGDVGWRIDTVFLSAPPTLDFGDAPDSYPVLLSDDGARHTVGSLFLGSGVDPEFDGSHSVEANDDGSDENGITFTNPIAALGNVSIEAVSSQAGGLLNAWLDFNRDGDWSDPGEQIFADRSLTAGVNTLNFAVPADAKSGPSYARFRLSTNPGLTVTGLATDGEVEDYRVTIATPRTWIPLGPFSATNGQVENMPKRSISGAMHTVLAHPTNANILYAGSVNGGVWKTTNATDTNPHWVALTDALPSQSIGALTFDLADGSSNTIFAGTGRYSSFGREGNRRVGLYKSVNGGQTWQVIDGGGILAGKNISGIYANGNTIVVSVNVADSFTYENIGIFRSTNGGASFTQMSVGNGAATGLPGGVSYDLVYDPINPNILYTSTVFSDGVGGLNGVYKSTNAGATWTRVSTPAMNALIVNNTSNLELAAGRNNEVYAAIINAGAFAGLFRSPDNGVTWVQMDSPRTNENGIDVGLNPSGGKGPTEGAPEGIAGGQGAIHFAIVADPTNANIVYVGGDRQPRSNGDTGTFPNSIGAQDFSGRLFRGDASRPAGTQFVHLTHSNALGAAGGGTASSSSPHADSREMTFDANGDLIEVDDGGIYRRTSPRTNTGDWFSINGTLQVTEAHDVAWDSLNNVAMTGNQDTGTTYQTGAGASLWDSLSTADGGDVAVDNLQLAGANQSVRYSSFQNLGAFRQTIWGASGELLATFFPTLTLVGGGPALARAFRTPLETNNVAGGRLLIQGTNGLYESTDSGATITSIGNGVGVSSINTNAIVYGGTKDGVANPDLVWAASSSNVFVRTAGTGNVVATPGDPTTATIRDLAVNSRDWANAYVIDDNQVFQTVNTGGNWTDITGDLMSFATDLRSITHVANAAFDAIIVGTNTGVYATLASAIGTWFALGSGFPNALVYDLDYDATDDVLVSGTLGRGAWMMEFVSLILTPNQPPIDIGLSATTLPENAGSNALVGVLNTLDFDPDQSFTYSLVAGAGDTDNAAFNIDGSALRATNSLDFELKSTYLVRIRSTDLDGLFVERAFTITLTNVNETPTSINVSSSSITENAGVNATVGVLSTADPDAANTFTYTLVAGTGDVDNAAFNINGAALRATNSFDFETKSSYTVRVRSTDQGGLFTESVFTISVVNVNEAPSDIGLSNASIAENSGPNATVGAFSTTDVDFGNTFTYALVGGTGGGDNGSFNISGSTLRATNSLNFEAKSSYSVRVRSTDQGGLFTDKVFLITVTDVNEAPSNITLSSTSIAENAGDNATVGTFSTIDADAGNTFTYSLVAGVGGGDNGAFNIVGNSLRATNSLDFEAKPIYAIRVRSTDQGGLFTETTFTITVTNVNETPIDIGISNSSVAENAGVNATVGTLSTVDVDAGNTFTYSLVAGAGDADNGAFNLSGATLRATSSFDFEARSSYSIRIRSTDQGGLFTEKAFVIAVTNANEAPVDIVLLNGNVPENAGANATAGVLSTIDIDTGNTFTYTLVTGAGDSDNAAFFIVADSIRTIGSFNFEARSSYNIRVRSTDQGGLFTEKALMITVTDVNEAPTIIDLSNATIAENAGSNVTIGNLSTIDVDAGNSFTYTLVPGAGDTDNAAFNIVGNTLRANNSFDYEANSSYIVLVRSTDQGGLFVDRAFAILVTNVNEVPTNISLSNAIIPENAGSNTTVGTLSTADPDEANTFTYNLVSGPGDTDNSAFNIFGTTLRATTSLDFEAKSNYTVRVRSTDQGGLFFEKEFTIALTNVNESPANVSVSPSSIAENAGANSTVGTLSTTDPDFGNTFTYALVTGAGDVDNSAFNISGSALRATNSFNFESKSSYTVRVRSTDQGGLFTERALTIGVVDINEPPTDVSLAGTSIAENNAADATIGTFTTTDVDAGSSFTYSLVAGAGGNDNLAFNISGSTLRASSVFDFETKSSYSVRVRSTDQGGLFTEKTFTISVTDVNEAPTNIGLSNASVLENAGVNATVGTLIATDVDAGNTFTYSLVAGAGSTDNGAFSISGNTLRASNSFDFETKSSYTVRIRATDQGGLFTEKAFAIAVVDVNETPTNIGLSNASVSENAGANATVGVFTTTDIDAGNTFTYSLVAGAGDSDNSAFNISGDTLRATSSFDFESKSLYTVRIRSTDQGGLFTEKSFIIAVVDANEAPTNIGLSSAGVPENAGINAPIGTLSTSDIDAGNTFTYALVDGVGDDDNPAFAILGSTLLANDSFDFETRSSYTVRIRSTDQGGLFTEKVFVITVTDSNETPTDIGLSNVLIAENAGPNATVGTLSSVDPDAGNTFSYALVAGAGSTDNGAFSISGNTLRASNSFDFETKSSYMVRIRSTDQGGLFTEKAFAISVVNVNETPTGIGLSNTSIVENAGTDATVGTFTTTDADAGDTFTYSLATGAGDGDNGAFNISGNTLRATSGFDFEGKSLYTVRVRSTDQGGLFTEKSFIITVVDANEAPTNIGLSSASVPENAGINAPIGTLSTSDIDAGNTFTYALVDGVGDDDNPAFAILGSTLLAVDSFDFETRSSYTVRIRSTDQGGLFTEKVFVVTATDVNETPTDIGLSNALIAENAGPNATVGTLSSVDPDGGSTFTYSLVAGAGSTDNGAFSISGNTLRASNSFDFETKSSYTVRIRSTDQGGLFTEKAFTISVVNVNETPTGIGLSNASILENAGANATVGVFTTTDIDAGNTFIYSLVAGSGDSDNNAFNISGDTLRATSSFDFESKSLYTVRVRSTDQGGLFTEKVFVVNVSNVNESPSATADSFWITVGVPELLQVLDNDSDIDSSLDPSSIGVVVAPLHGTATPTADGRIRYVPNAGFRGLDSFTYQVRDSQGLPSNQATVTLQVNSAPIANADSFVAKRNVATVLNVLSNDTDPDGTLNPATVSIVSAPSTATVEVLADGKLRFTPNGGFLGTTKFQYVVSDNDGRPSAPTEVTVLVVVSTYQNPRNKYDVDDDGSVSPLDVLALVNLLNASGPTIPVDGLPGPPDYVDVNGDNEVTPIDVLEVVNYINGGVVKSGEGEGGAGRTVSSMPLGAPAIEFSKADKMTMFPGAPIRSQRTGEVFDAPVLSTVDPVVAHATSRVASSPRFEADPGSANDSSLLSLDEYFERLGRERSNVVRSRRA